MKYDIAKIADAIKKAAAAAQQFADTEDGGTCNMDAPFINAKGMTEAAAKDIGTLSGVRVYIVKSSIYGRILMLSLNWNGQAACRTRMAEAAHESLKSSGIAGGMWYQVD